MKYLILFALAFCCMGCSFNFDDFKATPIRPVSPISPVSPPVSPIETPTPMPTREDLATPVRVTYTPTPMIISPIATPTMIGSDILGGYFYIVEAGDNLWSIACRAYEGRCFLWEHIMTTNFNSRNYNLHPGDEIYIPIYDPPPGEDNQQEF